MRSRVYSTEEIEIRFGKRTIPVTLAWMDRKTIRVKVYRDGTVHAAAPRHASRAQVLRWIERRAGWMAKRLREAEALPPPQRPRRYVSGESHRYLGRQYRLKILPAQRNQVKLIGPFFEIHARRTDDPDSLKRHLNRWYLDHAKARYRSLVELWLPRLGRHGVKRPEIRVRRMKARWGSCNKKKGSLLFNTRLAEAPLSCVEYVVVHELCHLVHPNHSKAFYRLLEILLPDWKERKKRLERLGIL